MITTYQELKEAFCDFNNNNDEFLPDVDVVPCGSENAAEYALIYTGQEPIERKDFKLPISHEDFEILCAEFWDYIDWYLDGGAGEDPVQEESLPPTPSEVEAFKSELSALLRKHHGTILYSTKNKSMNLYQNGVPVFSVELDWINGFNLV